MHRRTPVVALVSALALSTLSTGIAAAHPDQHGVNDGHLLGPGEWGKIDLLGVVELTQTEGLIADVTVSPDGDTAFLNWGEPDCAGPESGGQTSLDAGAYVVDISNIETDPGSAELIGFIPSHQDTRPGEGMQVVEITTSSFSGDVLVMNNEACGKNAKGAYHRGTSPTRRNPRSSRNTSVIGAPARVMPTRSTAPSPGMPATTPTWC